MIVKKKKITLEKKKEEQNDYKEKELKLQQFTTLNINQHDEGKVTSFFFKLLTKHKTQFAKIIASQLRIT